MIVNSGHYMEAQKDTYAATSWQLYCMKLISMDRIVLNFLFLPDARAVARQLQKQGYQVEIKETAEEFKVIATKKLKY